MILYDELATEQIAGVADEHSARRSHKDLDDAARHVPDCAARNRIDADELRSRLRTRARTQLKAHWQSVEVVTAALERRPLLLEADIARLVNAA